MNQIITNPQDNISFCEDTIKIFTQANLGYIVTAKRLAEIAEKRLYLPKWESFDLFTMECIKQSKGKTNELMNIYRKFVVMGEVEEKTVGEVPWTVMRQALPLVKTKEDAEYWIEQATTLLPSDFNRAVKEAKTGKDMTQCAHKETYMLRVCSECKDSREIYDIASFTEMDLYNALEENKVEITFEEVKNVFKALAAKSYEAKQSIQQ